MSNKKNKLDKLKAGILFSSYFDTIGFKNGEWEFNYGKGIHNLNDLMTAGYTIIHHYMSLGGFSNIDISNWKSSDDTILLMATTKALIDGGSELDFIKRYIEIYDELIKNERYAGRQTLKSISYLKKITQKKRNSYLDLIPYDDEMGGNGAAIRTGPIGIYYANDIDKLIECSITCSRLTHNIPIGYLGGLLSALFASYAYNGIDSWLWIDNLIDLIKSKKIIKYINSTNIGTVHDKAINDYFSYWFKYKEKRFDDLINFRRKAEFIFPKERLNSLSNYNVSYGEENIYYIGSSGLDSIIYSYDSLIMSLRLNERLEINFDKPLYILDSLIFFGCLHIGDSDSTGAILGFWYGIINGLPDNKLEDLKKIEYYDDLNKLSKKLFNKIH
jgi:ADP-ribosylglycohydrolase